MFYRLLFSLFMIFVNGAHLSAMEIVKVTSSCRDTLNEDIEKFYQQEMDRINWNRWILKQVVEENSVPLDVVNVISAIEYGLAALFTCPSLEEVNRILKEGYQTICKYDKLPPKEWDISSLYCKFGMIYVHMTQEVNRKALGECVDNNTNWVKGLEYISTASGFHCRYTTCPEGLLDFSMCINDPYRIVFMGITQKA